MDAGQPQTSEFLVSWRDGPAAYLRLERPHKANSYTQPMLQVLAAAVERAASDADVRVLVITGAGDRNFCGGADLGEIADRDWNAPLNLKSAEVFTIVSRFPRVTLAAVNGAAVGGGLELALACDLRIASVNARFWLPEPLLGLIPAAGGTQRLQQVVGKAKAKELILGGAVWGADEALRLGLVSEVATAENLMLRAKAWVDQIARRDPLALQLAKKAIDLESPGNAGFGFESLAQTLLERLRLSERQRLSEGQRSKPESGISNPP